MKKFLTIILSIALCCTVINIADYVGFIYSAVYAENVNGVITAENISLEYTEAFYDGASHKPEVSVTVDGNVLSQGSDYSVRFPADTTNVGIKTLYVTGKGSYSGRVELHYAVKQLDCGNAEKVTVSVGDCYYNGLPQYPDVTVKYNGNVIPDSEYTLSLSDNVEVSEDSGAVCIVKFRGNCSGERMANFKILKANPDDLEVDLVAKPGQSFSIDLSDMKPVGAVFCDLTFSKSDFSEEGQPKIAFNVLNFTLDNALKRSTMVAVHLTNVKNSADYWLEFYIEIVEKEIPALSLKPIVKEYDGELVSAEELSKNGSVATVDGTAIQGEWVFTTDIPRKPVDKFYAVVKFIPDDERHSYVYGIVPVTVARKTVEDFTVSAKQKNIDIAQNLELTVKGIPDDFDGRLTVTDKSGTELAYEMFGIDGKNGYALDVILPDEEAVFTVLVTLGGSAVYASCTEEIRVVVGNPDETAYSATTETELLAMIENADTASTIRTYNMKSVSAAVLKKAAEKKLIIEAKANDNLSLVLEPAKMGTITDLNLTVNRAVIPPVLLENLGDEELVSFTTFAKSSEGISVKAALEFEKEHQFVCMYYYDTTGELERLYTVKRNSASVKFGLPYPGKFVITNTPYSHIKGDVNNDGIFSSLDLTEALELFVSISGEPDKEQIFKIDFNNDGIITTDDLRELLEYFVSIP